MLSFCDSYCCLSDAIHPELSHQTVQKMLLLQVEVPGRCERLRLRHRIPLQKGRHAWVYCGGKGKAPVLERSRMTCMVKRFRASSVTSSAFQVRQRLNVPNPSARTAGSGGDSCQCSSSSPAPWCMELLEVYVGQN